MAMQVAVITYRALAIYFQLSEYLNRRGVCEVFHSECLFWQMWNCKKKTVHNVSAIS